MRRRYGALNGGNGERERECQRVEAVLGGVALILFFRPNKRPNLLPTHPGPRNSHPPPSSSEPTLPPLAHLSTPLQNNLYPSHRSFSAAGISVRPIAPPPLSSRNTRIPAPPSFLATRSTICQPLPPCRRLLLPLLCLCPPPSCDPVRPLRSSPLAATNNLQSHTPPLYISYIARLASPFSPGPRATCGLDCGTAQTRAVVWLYSTPAIDPASRPNPAM
ncbi:hypothetical protein C8Q73DRAFT_139144 [Cubamyces lactineus]|nr:hypothetical protein C8Q73DRAFT_139144 [Cubamyces lactineus]